MPRKGPAPRRELMPDPVYRSVLVTQMVNKVLRMYQDQGLIALDGHDITIRDMAGLKARIAG